MVELVIASGAPSLSVCRGCLWKVFVKTTFYSVDSLNTELKLTLRVLALHSKCLINTVPCAVEAWEVLILQQGTQLSLSICTEGLQQFAPFQARCSVEMGCLKHRDDLQFAPFLTL